MNYDDININSIFLFIIFTAKTSVGPYTGLKKFLAFLFMFVCVYCDTGCRNYSVHLNFGRNVRVLSEIYCIVFGVPCSNSSCTRIHKNVSLHYGLWREMCLYSCLFVCDVLQLNSYIVFAVHQPNSACTGMHQKCIKALRPMVRNIF